jgi:signal transduction histidine kinase
MVTRQQWIERAAIGLAAFALLVGILTPVVARMDPGVALGVDEATGHIVVTWVEPLSPAARWGIQPGMVAVTVNDQQVLRLPSAIYPDPSPGVTADPETGDYPQPSPYFEPTVPTPVTTSAQTLFAIASQPVRSLEAVSAAALSSFSPNNPGFSSASFSDDGRNSLRDSIFDVVFGIGLLFTIAWWLVTGRGGEGMRDLGLPLALATSAPFILAPLDQLWQPLAIFTHALLLPAAMLPLAVALVGRIEEEQDRRITEAGVAVCAAGAIIVGLSPVLGLGLDAASTTGLFIAGIAVIPGFIAAGPMIPGARATTGRVTAVSGRVLQSTELAIAGLTPAVALVGRMAGGQLAMWLFLLWVGAIGAAGRFTVRPLARLASRAQLQRDLVVAATEAERARVAADIHDDALQELTLLVRRLDTAGDKEGADIARTVSDKLRAICGDLRLPILDDLGVGPALDWLVLRIERLAGGEVRLERADGTRPPPDVELAFFRVAQEALANAVKHGKPPIVVRYRSSDGAASLSIDDSGAGITPDAGDRAEREGHFGLLNMQQRAEAIGAILDVRRWPTGGTHVQLEWRAR